MLSSAITSKGQVTIPSQLRKQMGLQTGDKVGFAFENNHIVLYRKITDISAAFGLCHPKRSVTLEEMEAAIQRRGAHDSG
ncbi:AbrB/MazE/SpoVT family DNA-binding domain-containing protein [soil metagenome]